MRKILVLAMLIVAIHTSAQLKFFLEGSGNVSLISSSKARSTKEVNHGLQEYRLLESQTYTAKYKSRLGGGVSAGVYYFFADDFSIDAGIDFAANRFYQQLLTETVFYYPEEDLHPEVVFPSPPEPISQQESANHTMFLMSIPVSLSYYLLDNNLSVSVGVLPGFLLSSAGGNAASREFNRTALGIQVQLRYQFMPKLWITAGVQEYSTKLYDPEQKKSFSSLRLLKLGIRRDI